MATKKKAVKKAVKKAKEVSVHDEKKTEEIQEAPLLTALQELELL